LYKAEKRSQDREWKYLRKPWNTCTKQRTETKDHRMERSTEAMESLYEADNKLRGNAMDLLTVRSEGRNRKKDGIEPWILAPWKQRQESICSDHGSAKVKEAMAICIRAKIEQEIVAKDPCTKQRTETKIREWKHLRKLRNPCKKQRTETKRSQNGKIYGSHGILVRSREQKPKITETKYQREETGSKIKDLHTGKTGQESIV
jgi:hypothetical protein